MSVGPTCHRELLAIRGLWHTAAEDLWQQLRIHLAAGAARSTQHKAHRTAGVHANGQGFKRGRGRHATQTVLHPAQAGTTGRRAWSQPAMHACMQAGSAVQTGRRADRQTDRHPPECRVAANFLQHVELRLAVAGEPDLARAAHPRAAHLRKQAGQVSWLLFNQTTKRAPTAAGAWRHLSDGSHLAPAITARHPLRCLPA
jgi:hypothetical protein